MERPSADQTGKEMTESLVDVTRVNVSRSGSRVQIVPRSANAIRRPSGETRGLK